MAKVNLPGELSDPHTLGYWARVHDLTFEQAINDERLAEYVEYWPKEFSEGWEVADGEIAYKKVSGLVTQLESIWRESGEAEEPCRKRTRTPA